MEVKEKREKAPLGVWGSFMQLFFPRLCEGCSQSLLAAEEVLCIGCTAHLPLTDYHDVADNITALRFAGRVPFQYATSLAYFTAEGLLQHLLHELKYKDKKEIAIYLGRQFGYSLRSSAWIKEIDYIIPVPLHPKKEALRGFNQSLLIAEGMGDALTIPVCDENLYRRRHTESQTKKSRTERLDNMKDVFELRDEMSLSQKHVLLVDDVLTTGATLEACALSLLKVQGLKISFGSIGIAMD
jgi:ComF family protein